MTKYTGNTYGLVKLEKPIFRPGRRIFRYVIYKVATGEKVFLFEDKPTAEQTLEKLN